MGKSTDAQNEMIITLGALLRCDKSFTIHDIMRASGYFFLTTHLTI
jgi:seryl-tRNA(Sec) selenium transferase